MIDGANRVQFKKESLVAADVQAEVEQGGNDTKPERLTIDAEGDGVVESIPIKILWNTRQRVGGFRERPVVGQAGESAKRMSGWTSKEKQMHVLMRRDGDRTVNVYNKKRAQRAPTIAGFRRRTGERGCGEGANEGEGRHYQEHGRSNKGGWEKKRERWAKIGQTVGRILCERDADEECGRQGRM